MASFASFFSCLLLYHYLSSKHFREFHAEKLVVHTQDEYWRPNDMPPLTARHSTLYAKITRTLLHAKTRQNNRSFNMDVNTLYRFAACQGRVIRSRSPCCQGNGDALTTFIIGALRRYSNAPGASREPHLAISCRQCRRSWCVAYYHAKYIRADARGDFGKIMTICLKDITFRGAYAAVAHCRGGAEMTAKCFNRPPRAPVRYRYK